MQKKYFGTCSIPECIEPYLAKGLCRKHYTKMWKEKYPYGIVPQSCTIDGCKQLALIGHKNMCKKHYKRMIRHNTPERLLGEAGECSVDRCANIGTGNPRLCTKHRHNQVRYGSPTKTAKDMPKELLACAVPTCSTVRINMKRKKKPNPYCVRHSGILYKHNLHHQEFSSIFGLPPYICYLCGKQLDLNSTDVQVDHVYPVSLGGDSIPNNLKLTCKMCNQAKRNLTYSDFVALCKSIYLYSLLPHEGPINMSA